MKNRNVSVTLFETKYHKIIIVESLKYTDHYKINTGAANYQLVSGGIKNPLHHCLNHHNDYYL